MRQRLDAANRSSRFLSPNAFVFLFFLSVTACSYSNVEAFATSHRRQSAFASAPEKGRRTLQQHHHQQQQQRQPLVHHHATTSELEEDPNDETFVSVDGKRRRLMSAALSGLFGLSTSLSSYLLGTPSSTVVVANAAQTTMESMLQPADSLELQSGLLESRVTENVLSPPPYGMEAPDILYPSWFAGTWNVASKNTEVTSPCGKVLFGGNATYQNALKEIGTTLNYDSRFVPVGATIADPSENTRSGCIADREFNVKSIARAAMGANSVVDVRLASPNKFSCVLAPIGSPSLLNVDLITLNRRQERVSSNQFDCAEVVREIVAPVGSSSSPNANSGLPGSASSPPPILKEIETASLYTYHPDTDTITSRQRSASFLLPSQQSAMAMKMWEATRGRPVDVRYYDVLYTRR